VLRVPSCGLSTSTNSLGKHLFLQLVLWLNARQEPGLLGEYSTGLIEFWCNKSCGF
jgi:hypothetical protein